MAINQRHGVPRIPGGTPFAMRRSHFLGDDYKQKCFYGPRQSFFTGVQQTLDVTDLGRGPFEMEYTPPGDWPAAGTLLRVPQVVFLASRMSELTPDFSDPDFDPSGFDGTVNEDYRLWQIFTDVVSTMNSLRPGRTFVDIIVPTTITPMIDTMDPFLAPPVGETSYFGTDFLYFYAGVPVGHPLLIEPSDPLHRYSTRAVGITPYMVYTGIQEYVGFGGSAFLTPPDDPFGDPVPGIPIIDHFSVLDANVDSTQFLGAKARLEAAQAGFRRYTSWVYAPRLGGVGTDLGLNAFDPSDPAIPLGNANIQLLSQYLETLCADCSDLGVAFKGVSMTEVLSAGDLVNAIADHFGFNPATGKDL